MKIAVLLITASLTFGQSGPGSPFLGQMIDREHRLRPVYGVGGSFRIGPPVAERVLSASCSVTLCLAKTESAIVSTTSETPAPQGDAKIALDNSGATIYFPKIGQFARWQSGTLSPLDMAVDGTVLSIASRPAGIVIAVAGSSGVWITALDGTTLDSLPPDARDALLLPNATAYTTSDSVAIRKSDGSELRFPAPGVTELYAIGDGYVEAVSGDSIYALRTVPGKEQLFQLPEFVEEHRTVEKPRTVEEHQK